MSVHLLTPKTRYWQCPSCSASTSSSDPKVLSAMHACAALNITAPMVEIEWGKEVNTSQVRHVIKPREDYVGGDDGALDANGDKIFDDKGNWVAALPRDHSNNVVMSVQTERADGSNDTHVFAPAARLQKD